MVCLFNYYAVNWNMFYIFIEFIYWLIDFDMDYVFCYFGSNLISGTTINLPTMLVVNLAICHVFFR